MAALAGFPTDDISLPSNARYYTFVETKKSVQFEIMI